MANYPQCTLYEAWQRYWPVVVGRVAADLEKDLDVFVRSNLAQPDSFSFEQLGSDSPKLPVWMDVFTVSVSPDGVEVQLMQKDDANIALPTLTAPLFSWALAEFNPTWASSNPMQTIVERPPDILTAKGAATLKSLWNGECQKLVRYVAKKTGVSIKQRLEACLRQGSFELYALDSDPSRGQFQVDRAQFNRPFSMADTLGTLTFNNPYRVLSGLTVHCPKAHKTKPKTQKSFAEEDHQLLEQMKRLVDRKDAKTIKAAAEVVAVNALRKLGADDDSVVKRLTRGFAKAFPNYRRKRA